MYKFMHNSATNMPCASMYRLAQAHSVKACYLFGYAPVSHFAVSKQPLDNKEHILTPAANTRLLVFDISVPVKTRSQALPVMPVAGVGVAVDGGQVGVCFERRAVGKAGVACITILPGHLLASVWGRFPAH